MRAEEQRIALSAEKDLEMRKAAHEATHRTMKKKSVCPFQFPTNSLPTPFLKSPLKPFVTQVLLTFVELILMSPLKPVLLSFLKKIQMWLLTKRSKKNLKNSFSDAHRRKYFWIRLLSYQPVLNLAS